MQHARAAGLTPRALLQQRIAWRHPEWWSMGLSVVAWFILAAEGGSSTGVHHWPRHHVEGGSSGGAMAADAGAWLLMVVAMMFPLVIGSIRAAAERSLWRRRHRAIGLFLLGYTATWMLVGACLIALLETLRSSAVVETAAVAAAGFGIAAVWQLTPVRRRALRACERTIPLAPSGLRADASCLRFGWTVGVQCVATCWALMAACALTGHSVPAMAGAALIAAADRYIARPPQRLSFAILLSVAACYAAVALAQA